MYKGCIFDLDGTLINSLYDLAGSVNHALHILGFPTHEVKEYRYFVGHGAVIMIASALPANTSQDIKDKALAIFREHYAEHCLDKTVPYDGIPEVLSVLREKGVKLAVNSNKPDDFVKQIVTKTFGSGFFSAVIGQHGDVPIKPDPSGAFEACRIMGVNPADCVYIGDSDVDIKAGQAAGMFRAGALWGFRGAQELKNAGAEKLLANPREITGIFKLAL